MTNTIALFLGIALAVCLAADFLANDGAASLFVARKFIGFVDVATFWD